MLTFVHFIRLLYPYVRSQILSREDRSVSGQLLLLPSQWCLCWLLDAVETLPLVVG
jgi:hypothetical protein